MKNIRKIKYTPKVGQLEELLDLLQIRYLISKGQQECDYYEVAKTCIENNCEIEVSTSWDHFGSYDKWISEKANSEIEGRIKECSLHIEEEYYDSANPAFSKDFVQELKNKYKSLIPQDLVDIQYLDENEKLAQEVEKLKDINLRLMADMQNQKRISDKEKENIKLYSNEEFVKNIIVTMDTLQAALKYKKDEIQGDIDYQSEYHSLLKGIELTIGRLKDVFKNNKIEEIEAIGEFDPELHQALSVMESQGFKNNEIIETVQSGYTYNKKVIRPSMVVVCKREG